jgi:hypothetical protein
VNGFLARRNKEEGREDPAIRLTFPDGTKKYCKHLTIDGPSVMIQEIVDRDNPNKPYIYLETESEIDFE